MALEARRVTAAVVLVALVLVGAPQAWAQAPAPAPDTATSTPPRLSYIDGQVSFWRPGAEDWTPAQPNIALAPGDELYTGHPGNIELQIGPRAFVRAWGDTQLGLANQVSDLLQLRVTTGYVALDVRGVEPGRAIEVDTPHAAFTIDRPGYYRVDVAAERTSFIARRAGQATMTRPDGPAVVVAPSEEVVVDAGAAPAVQSFVAPDPDVWDRWNQARTDELLDSVSSRYVPQGVYGIDDLDHHGDWRVVPTYGAVWMPHAMPAGWAPYTTGRWVWDPRFGWTWVDTAVWGWAPYHHGRWVYLDGLWAWAPGPIVARPVYAPALVAFFSAPGIRVSVGVPFVSWVALGWGEPVVPWWGRPGFIGRPAWIGWGGPRIVNNVVINRTTVVNVNEIHVYRNATVPRAIVAVPPARFGRAQVQESRVTEIDPRRLEPVRGPLRVSRDAASLAPASGRATRPPEAVLSRPVVATRPAPRREPDARARRDAPDAVKPAPAPRIAPPPRAAQTAPVPPRAPFGASPLERRRESAPPRLDAAPGSRETAPAPRDGAGGAPPAVIRPEPRRAEPPAARVEPGPQRMERAPRLEPSRPDTRSLPGEPANRLFPGRREQVEPRRAPGASAAPGLRGAASQERGRGEGARGERAR